MPRKAVPTARSRAKAPRPTPPPPVPAYTDTWLAVDTLHRDERIQPRLQLQDQTVRDYADLYREASEGEEPLPPLDVFHLEDTPDGAPGQAYAVADGFHRLAAAQHAAVTQLHCHVYPGTLRDAMVHAALANVQRGLAYNDGDKERIITRFLADAEYAAYTDRALAHRLGMSNGYVSRLRRRLEARTRLQARVCTVHTTGEDTTPTPEHLAALLQVPQDAIARASMVSFAATPARLLDRVVRLIADEGMEESSAIEQVASQFRLYEPEPEAPFSRWPRPPSAAERREKRGQAQQEERIQALIAPLSSFTEELEDLVLPIATVRVLMEDDTYERPAHLPTLEDAIDAVAAGRGYGLDHLAESLSRVRAIVDAIEAAMVAHAQAHGSS